MKPACENFTTRRQERARLPRAWRRPRGGGGRGRGAEWHAFCAFPAIPSSPDIRRHVAVKISYILPLRSVSPHNTAELTAYLRWLAGRAEVLVVDGSPPEVFREHQAAWGDFVVHLPPAADLVSPMGKVGGVLTGVRHATHDRLIIADDDVRYDEQALQRMAVLLERADVVRPQNFFHPLPWHAWVDTARILLNRATGGDWPGTLGVRRSVLLATGGYDGDVLFENLELVRTVRAAGGAEAVPLDLFVRRSPPETSHFWDQRVRQAYDEFARPARMAVFLSLIPLAGSLAGRKRWRWLAGAAAAAVALAESGRRRGGGTAVFPAGASLLAPVWLLERGVCAWLAVGSRLRLGGVRYRDSVLVRAASSERDLWARHAGVRAKRVSDAEQGAGPTISRAPPRRSA